MQRAVVAAGHEGIMQDQSGELFFKRTTAQEIAFYESVQEHPDLAEHVPVYMGQLAETDPSTAQMVQEMAASRHQAQLPLSTNSNDKILVLENLTHGFMQPNIIDLKLGTRLWDDNTNPEKRQRLDQVSATTTSGSLGFRIAGINVYDPRSTQRVLHGKQFGRDLTSDNVVGTGLRQAFFLDQVEKTLQRHHKALICEHAVEALILIRRAVAECCLELYSGSILIIYEGDKGEFERKLEQAVEKDRQEKEEDDKYGNGKERRPEREEDDKDRDDEDDKGRDDDDEEDEEDEERLVVVRLVDFAHARFTNTQHQSTLTGLDSLIQIFEQLVLEYQDDFRNSQSS